MKTKTKIQTKKSTAVSVVSIEGHPVPTSSPSKVLGGLLSLKGDEMGNLVHIDDLNVKIVDKYPSGLIDIGVFPLIHENDIADAPTDTNDGECGLYLETSDSGKAFLIDDQNSSKDRAEWIPLSQVTLLRCTGKAFEGCFTTLIPFWLAKDKKFI
jgi:hypothetical protein